MRNNKSPSNFNYITLKRGRKGITLATSYIINMFTQGSGVYRTLRPCGAAGDAHPSEIRICRAVAGATLQSDRDGKNLIAQSVATAYKFRRACGRSKKRS